MPSLRSVRGLDDYDWYPHCWCVPSMDWHIILPLTVHISFNDVVSDICPLSYSKMGRGRCRSSFILPSSCQCMAFDTGRTCVFPLFFCSKHINSIVSTAVPHNPLSGVHGKPIVSLFAAWFMNFKLACTMIFSNTVFVPSSLSDLVVSRAYLTLFNQAQVFFPHHLPGYLFSMTPWSWLSQS